MSSHLSIVSFQSIDIDTYEELLVDKRNEDRIEIRPQTTSIHYLSGQDGISSNQNGRRYQSVPSSEYERFLSNESTNLMAENGRDRQNHKNSYGSVANETERSQIAATLSSKCTIFETYCNLVSLITGSGLLALPFAAKAMGWSAVLLLIVLGCIYMYTLYLVGQSIEFLHIRRVETLSRIASSSSTIATTHDNNLSHQQAIASNNLSQISPDYLSLGQAVFGEFGGKIVAISLAFELTLAIVSFFINIGLNISAINPKVHPIMGIYIATFISLILSSMNMKLAAYSSAFGVLMTSLVILSLALSAGDLMEYENSLNISSNQRIYVLSNITGFPVALGLISFCFGGHCASPSIYTSMMNPKDYQRALIPAGVTVMTIYLVVMVIGYVCYAQYSKIPSKWDNFSLP